MHGYTHKPLWVEEGQTAMGATMFSLSCGYDCSRSYSQGVGMKEWEQEWEQVYALDMAVLPLLCAYECSRSYTHGCAHGSERVGTAVGAGLGTVVGAGEGTVVGGGMRTPMCTGVGAEVGEGVGAAVGEGVGAALIVRVKHRPESTWWSSSSSMLCSS